MHIYIPTRGRPHKQTTLYALPTALRAHTTLVVHPNELAEYRLCHPTQRVVPLASDVIGIAATRQWIMEQHQGEYLCMLDDDLKFFVKTVPERKIVAAAPTQIEAMFAQLAEWLQAGIAHCGITPRSLNWQHPGPFMTNTRMMHVLAYNVPVVLRAGCSFTHGVPSTFSMDDFHMTLQLFAVGYGNRVDVDNCTSPSASNSAGGASLWRTLQTQNASAERLAELHPGFVNVKIKQRWQGMDGDRKDVIIQWQKAARKCT